MEREKAKEAEAKKEEKAEKVESEEKSNTDVQESGESGSEDNEQNEPQSIVETTAPENNIEKVAKNSDDESKKEEMEVVKMDEDETEETAVPEKEEVKVTHQDEIDEAKAESSESEIEKLLSESDLDEEDSAQQRIRRPSEEETKAAVDSIASLTTGEELVDTTDIIESNTADDSLDKELAVPEETEMAAEQTVDEMEKSTEDEGKDDTEEATGDMEIRQLAETIQKDNESANRDGGEAMEAGDMNESQDSSFPSELEDVEDIDNMNAMDSMDSDMTNVEESYEQSQQVAAPSEQMYNAAVQQQSDTQQQQHVVQHEMMQVQQSPHVVQSSPHMVQHSPHVQASPCVHQLSPHSLHQASPHSLDTMPHSAGRNVTSPEMVQSQQQHTQQPVMRQQSAPHATPPHDSRHMMPPMTQTMQQDVGVNNMATMQQQERASLQTVASAVYSDMSQQSYPAPPQMEIDPSTLGLESPTSISSNEMPGSNCSSSLEPAQTPQNYVDCAQAQVQGNFSCNGAPSAGVTPDYMDGHGHGVTVQLQNSTAGYVPPSTPISNNATYAPPHTPIPPHTPHTPAPPSVPISFQQNIQVSHSKPTQRLTHVTQGYLLSNSCAVTSQRQWQQAQQLFQQQPQQVPHHQHMHGHVQNVYGAQNTSCSIQKLQQLTNGIMDIVPQGPPINTMTPPPNLTPPPTMTPPPGSQRNLTPPMSNLQSQVSMTQGMNPAQYYKSYQRRHAQMQRSPNVTIGPNIMSGYNTYSYRLQQQAAAATPAAVINHGAAYIATNPGFINQSQVPFQMVNMNMNMNLPGQLSSQMQGQQMNYQVQDAAQMQPPRAQNSMNTAAMYTYGYIPYMRR